MGTPRPSPPPMSFSCRSRPASERLAALPSAGLCWAAVLLCRCCLRLPAALLAALSVRVVFVLRCPCSRRLLSPVVCCVVSCLSCLTFIRADRGWLKTGAKVECARAYESRRGVTGRGGSVLLLLPPFLTKLYTHQHGSTTAEHNCALREWKAAWRMAFLSTTVLAVQARNQSW